MRAKLSSIVVSNAPFGDYDTWEPPNPDSFYVEMTAYIGSEGDPNGDDGIDAFDFTVCTPDQLPAVYVWTLDAEQDTPEVLALRGVLVVSRWDRAALTRWLESLCEQAEADTWEKVGAQLNGRLEWEYEYRLNPDWRQGFR